MPTTVKTVPVDLAEPSRASRPKGLRTTDVLKITGMEYFNCDSNLRGTKSYAAMSLLRKVHQQKHETLLRQCSRKQGDNKRIKFNNITYSRSAIWMNNTCSLDTNKCETALRDECNANHFEEYEGSTEIKYGSIGRYCFLESKILRHRTSMIADKYDLRSPQQLLAVWNKNVCKMKEFAESYQPAIFSSYPTADENLKGLSCKTNNSLSFLALDSLMYHQFAERFGINILAQKNKTALLIVNDKEEVHYIFEEYLSDGILREFIINYTHGNLPRALHSNSVNYKSKDMHQTDCNLNDVCVIELDSHNFMETVMDDKVVIVLYFSKQCTFCNGISYMFLTASKMLSSIKHIQFARIDGDLNTLPWEFTMETYPSILFFPDKRKSESRAYPIDLPITVTNIISFILINLKSTLKLQIMWTICNQINHEKERRSCISSVRAENLGIIEETLKAWRMAEPRMKQGILRKLQQLKSLHLKLASEPEAAPVSSERGSKSKLQVGKLTLRVDYENTNDYNVQNYIL